MKLQTWNMQLIITAENDQDAMWLTRFVSHFEYKNTLGNYLFFEVGEINHDGKLIIRKSEDAFDEGDLSEFNEDELDGDVVRLTIRSFGYYIPEEMMRRLTIDYKEEKKAYNSWKKRLKKKMPDRYNEIIDFENKNK